jgi:hypothetical protein
MGVEPNDTVRKIGSQRGQASAEFVALFPLLLAVLFVVIEFGWQLKNYLVVTNAGREAARCAAVDRCQHEGADVDATELALERIHDGGAIHPDDTPAFQIYLVDEDTPLDGIEPGDSLVVCIESPSRHVTPLGIFAGWAGVLPNPVPIRARTEMRVERPYTGADVSADPGDGSCSPS